MKYILHDHNKYQKNSHDDHGHPHYHMGFKVASNLQ